MALIAHSKAPQLVRAFYNMICGMLSPTKYNWDILKENIINFGLRNSLLCAPMPTASTSQILGNNECFEPVTSNIYNRRTNAGEPLLLINMMQDLIELNFWNEDIKNNIIANHGSIQHMDFLPNIRDKYKTVWEIPMKHIIDMAADRGAFICQSQVSIYGKKTLIIILSHLCISTLESWIKNRYILFKKDAVHQAQQFTIEPEKKTNNEEDICEMCSG